MQPTALERDCEANRLSNSQWRQGSLLTMGRLGQAGGHQVYASSRFIFGAKVCKPARDLRGRSWVSLSSKH